MLRWGILGTGNIASVFAGAVAASTTGAVVAVGSRAADSGKKFRDDYAPDAWAGSYESLLARADVDVVYVSVPHHRHAEWSINAARAGKAVLCEKPGAISHRAAAAVIEAVRQHDVFYMEAFMYRCHKQTHRLIELLRDKAIGDIRLIECTFSYHADFTPEEAELARRRGGGAILDVGCYAVSMVRLIAGIELATDAALPIEVQGMGHIDPDLGSDDWAVANLRFPNDIIAQVSAGVKVEHRNDLRIFGSTGSIHVPSPWVPGGRQAGTTRITLKRRGVPDLTELLVETQTGLYVQEADTVAANIGLKQAREMSWQDTLANMQTLDMWREAVGGTYVDDSIFTS